MRGLRVVSLAVNLPGPLACAQLAARGAHVTKIEPPAGDLVAKVAPAWYAELIAGQDVITLDLAKPDGRDELDGFLETADLLVTATRPESLERLRITWAALHARFPKLNYVAIFGEISEAAKTPGHDLTYQARAGLLAPPAMPKVLGADILGAQCTVTAAVDALLERERFGAGVYREVALYDAALALAEPFVYGMTASGGILSGALPFYNMYATADGWIAVAALEPRFRAKLLEQLKLETETHEAFARAFKMQPCAFWEDLGRAHDLPIATVKTGA